MKPETMEERIAQIEANAKVEFADHLRRGLAWIGFFIGLGIACTNPAFVEWLR